MASAQVLPGCEEERALAPLPRSMHAALCFSGQVALGAAGLYPVGRQALEALPGAAVVDFGNKALPLTPRYQPANASQSKGGCP